MKKAMPKGNELIEILHLEKFINIISDKHRDRIAFKMTKDNTNVDISYSSFCANIKSVQNVIDELYPNKKHVALVGELDYCWILAFFAIVCSGRVVIPIENGLDPSVIARMLKKADAEVLLYSEKSNNFLTTISKEFENIVIEDIEHICKNKDCYEAVKGDGITDLNKDENDTAIIMFTSGTTGDSKCVMLSHKNICSNVSGIVNIFCNIAKEEDRIIPVLPPHHMFQLTAGLLIPLYLGLEICLGGSLKYISKSIQQYKPNVLVLVPVIVENMYNRIWIEANKQGREKQLLLLIRISRILLRFGIDMRRKLFASVCSNFGGELKIIVCGGAALDKKVAMGFEDFGILLLNGYGITECSPIISCNMPQSNDPSTVGPPISNSYVKFDEGEICVSGASVMKGYYKDKQATLDAFENGWFKTGDLGHLDEKGRIIISGRKKNLIILKDGNNVSPEELEEEIRKIEYVEDVIVYAKENNKNYVVSAMIHPESSKDIEISEKEIRQKIEEGINDLNKKLPAYKKIRIIDFREDAFVKTALGKIKKYLYIK